MNGEDKPKSAKGFSTDFKIVIAVILFWFFVLPPLLGLIGRIQEQRKKYQAALQRVDKAGGWEAIEAACFNFSTNIGPKTFFDQHYFLQGKRLATNALPPALEILQPRQIQLEQGSNGIRTIRLQLFGMHRTGMYDEPYFGIWVVCTNIPPNYLPVIEWREHGMRGLIGRKDHAIFEVR